MGEQGPRGPEGPAGGPSTAPLSISEIDAISGATYKTGYLAAGQLLYSDNDEIKFESVPAEISGQPYILTANEDKGLSGTTELVFHVNRPCFVYVLRDIRGTAAGGGQPPSWLANGFVKLDSVVEVSDSDMGSMAIYKSGMAMSGRISLGGNGAPPSVGYENNYVVVVAPSEEHATSGVGVIGLKIPADTEGNEAYEGSMGFSFTVNSPIYVMDLGVFNPLGSAPLPGTLSCRLYNMQTGELIAQQAFTEENRGDMKGGALYKALRSPVQLPAGFQAVIAADGYGSEMKNGNSEGAAPSWSFDNDGGKITFGSDALYGEKGEMPSEVAGSPGNRFAAATFRYT
ncbi:hypothetical protein GUITHDRAFT_166504 [Guillardia theta CCMP2712]|uniref:Uncharacterized protein n=1 Tax=Guillardia theta (strain CCMP2712) TaxID=905079 RepID=L1IAU6_GUITC|nr:hypothetical protein GUITHDRAFT_166504 [Guillardia theta CCMP2712]EKX33333.1 hypothetical protein GUITHDRAFT_166504 [Guillardia theta CCMP2712]|eukprot:XP_005820313.1 hypothetical protein GUITHDRAFT_166504 [Guillardia theta CCMP2712]